MKSTLNLLPWRFRLRLLFRIRLLQWMTVGGICVMAVGFAAFVKFRFILAEQSVLQTEQRKYTSLIAMKTQNTRVNKQLLTLRRRLALLEDFENKQFPLNLVGLVSESAVKSDHRIQVDDLSFTRTQKTVTDPTSTRTRNPKLKAALAKQSQTEEELKLVLKGTAADDLAVAKFIVSLRDSGVFERVELKSSIAEEIEGEKVRRYFLECTF